MTTSKCPDCGALFKNWPSYDRHPCYQAYLRGRRTVLDELARRRHIPEDNEREAHEGIEPERGVAR